MTRRGGEGWSKRGRSRRERDKWRWGGWMRKWRGEREREKKEGRYEYRNWEEGKPIRGRGRENK